MIGSHSIALSSTQPSTSGRGAYLERHQRCHIVLHSRRRTTCRAFTQQDVTSRLTSFTSQLDKLLADAQEASSEQAVLQLVESAQQEGVLRYFGNGEQVPKRIYSIEELRLNKIDASKLLSPEDSSLNFVRSVLQVSALAGLGSLALFSGLDAGQVGGIVLASSFFLVLDQIVNGGGGEALVVDTVGRLLKPSYSQRVNYHESAHFLIAYLVGILPKAYTLSSLDAFLRYRAFNIQAGCQFCDSAFTREVDTGRLSSGSLDRYTCVALAGVVAEYLLFGQAEGGLEDVRQLDRLLRALNFTQLKSDGQVRWAVLNVAALLRQHKALHGQLAGRMASGATVGECIQLIEGTLGTTT